MATSTGRKKKVGKVMEEFKHGELKSGGSGRKVKSRKQAIAIAMSESGQSRKRPKTAAGAKKATGRKTPVAKTTASKRSRKSR